MDEQHVYIVDLYNPYRDKDIKEIFYINERYWTIKEVNLEWGLPVLPIQLTDDAPEPQDFYLYNTYDEARAFLVKMKKINR